MIMFTSGLRPDIINQIDIRDTILSDHRLLEIGTNIDQPFVSPNLSMLNRSTLSQLNFYHKSVNRDNINDELGKIDWLSIFQAKTFENMYSILFGEIVEICKKCVPLRKPNSTTFIPRDRRICFKKIKEAQRKMRNESGPSARMILTNKILDLEHKILLSHQEEQAQTEKRAVK